MSDAVVVVDGIRVDAVIGVVVDVDGEGGDVGDDGGYMDGVVNDGCGMVAW